MQKSLNALFKIIDDLNENDNIKKFYKEALLLEFDNSSFRYKKVYEQLINSYLEDE